MSNGKRVRLWRGSYIGFRNTKRGISSVAQPMEFIESLIIPFRICIQLALLEYLLLRSSQ